MTIAVCAKCICHGAIVYADRTVMATDGTRTQGRKIYARSWAEGAAVLADASEDAIAGEGLARDILNDMEESAISNVQDAERMARSRMRSWSSHYSSPPALQYLMAVALSEQTHLFLLQPPDTVVPIPRRYAIGSGARIVDPMLDTIFPGDLQFSNRGALLRIGYMVRHAKEKDTSVGPGGSDAVYISPLGAIQWVEQVDLDFAEEQTKFIDECILMVLQISMGFKEPSELEKALDFAKRLLTTTASTITRNVKFRPLDSSEG